MPNYLRANFSYGILSTTIGTGDLILTVNAGHKLPTSVGFFVLTIWDSIIYPSPSNDPNTEIVIASYSGTPNLYEIIRAQESTSAVSHTAGSKCGLLLTAGLSSADFYILGTKEVDETGLSHGKFMYYNGTLDKLKYAALPGGGNMLQEVYDPEGIGHIPVVYQQSTQPTTGLYDGDFWINTNNNKIYTYKSGAWIDILGNSTTVFVQGTVPTALSSSDLWFNSSDSNRMYKSTNVGDNEIKAGEWEMVEVSGVQVFMQDGIPESTNIGDLWVDTNDGNKLYRAACVGATTIAAGQWEYTNVGGNRVFKQPLVPTSLGVGDLWVDTNDGNRLYRADAVGATTIAAGQWESIRDEGIAQALQDAATAIEDAATAQGTADGKVVTFFQSAIPIPTSEGIGDLWIDIDDDNKLYRAECIGANEIKAGEWVLVRDAGIGAAISAASTAQSTADHKIVTFYQASIPTSESTGDMWVDTNDENKLYRAAVAEATTIAAGQWELVNVATSATNLQAGTIGKAINVGNNKVLLDGVNGRIVIYDEAGNVRVILGLLP